MLQPENDVDVFLEYSEEVLECHKTELAKLREHYQTNKAVFEKIAKREDAWKKFLALEVCA